jgi:acetylornithine/succinyldiaminopimelate/putrescine aminotransferase
MMMSHDLRASTDRDRVSPRDHCRHAPALTGLLRLLALDVAYHRAAGDCVYHRDDGGDEVEVLDVVGGYGTLLLGHAHPQLVAEAARWLSSSASDVRAVRGGDELADTLAARTGRDDCVVFANSGTEAVEAAMKHAMLETGGRTFLAVAGGFHGKTLGALQLTASGAIRAPFAVSGINVVRVALNAASALERAFKQCDDLAGFIFEPILGEGGVHPLEPEFVRRAAGLCAQRQVPLIADECQTGLGRTGRFLESSRLGVDPEYVILSKALGGGLAKISVLLIDRSRYRPEFDRLHTSTFAADGFSCALALKTLELLNDELIADCGLKGAKLLERLHTLQSSYPDVIADVRGWGLMLGIELRPQPDSSSLLLRALTARQLLGPLVAGYLLKQRRVRIAPTLSSPLTLRIQPSALISDEQIDLLIDALDEACNCLARGAARELTAHLDVRREERRRTHDDSMLRANRPVSARPQFQQRQPRRNVAWLFHLIDADDLPGLNPALLSATCVSGPTIGADGAFAEPV